MHAERTGSGRPLLLVHGLGSSHRNWDPILAELAVKHEVVAVDLPGHGETPPLAMPTTIASLADELQRFVLEEDLDGIDLVGSSMGARLVLEMARRGHTGRVVALDPGGFWTDREVRVFGISIGASVALVRAISPALPLLVANRITRSILLAQFSVAPWRLPRDLVLTELRGFTTAPSLDAALDDLVHGARQQSAPAGSIANRVVIGWGRNDRVALPRQARRAQAAFPDAELHWFDHCGHFPHWDQPEQAAALILSTMERRAAHEGSADAPASSPGS